MPEINKHQFAINSLWKILEQFSARAVSFAVTIILARLLLPSDYGIIALTAIFTNLSNLLIDGGFSTALIRKKSVDEYDYGCVLIVSLAIATLLYILMFVFAPYIAKYYSEPILCPVLRVLGIVVYIQAFTVIRTAIVNRNMQFKLLFYCNFAGSMISGVIGIIAAYMGYGVWALVVQQLLQQALITALLFLCVKWDVALKFKLSRLKDIFSFSAGVVLSTFINYISSSLYGVVIGKKYSVQDLGYYSKGCQLPEQLSLYTFGAMSTVLLPTISACQDDIDRVKQIIRKVTQMTAYLIFPLMMGMLIASEEIIVLLLTAKWLPAASIMKSWCIYYIATPFMLINVQVFFALGKSYLRVKTEIIRALLMIIALFVCVFILHFNINQLCIVVAIIAVVVTFVTNIETRRLIGYKLAEVMSDIYKPLVASIVMCVVIVLLMKFFNAHGQHSLLIKCVIGATVYAAFSVLWKINSFYELLNLLKIKRGVCHE